MAPTTVIADGRRHPRALTRGGGKAPLRPLGSSPWSPCETGGGTVRRVVEVFGASRGGWSYEPRRDLTHALRSVQAHGQDFATIVRTSYFATTLSSWLVTLQSHRTSPWSAEARGLISLQVSCA